MDCCETTNNSTTEMETFYFTFVDDGTEVKTDYIFVPEKKNNRFAGMRLMEIHGSNRPSVYYDPAVHVTKYGYFSRPWRARKSGNTYELIDPFGGDGSGTRIYWRLHHRIATQL
jgi:hypothetical protein